MWRKRVTLGPNIDENLSKEYDSVYQALTNLVPSKKTVVSRSQHEKDLKTTALPFEDEFTKDYSLAGESRIPRQETREEKFSTTIPDTHAKLIDPQLLFSISKTLKTNISPNSEELEFSGKCYCERGNYNFLNLSH